MMARAATSDELTKLRSGKQASKIYLAIHNPAVVLACRVNQNIASLDSLSEIIYDGVTAGSSGNVLAGMTLWVGSSAGAYDKGRARIRKAATGSVLFIGLTSELQIADNDYLTVVDEFGLWAKPAVTRDEVTTIDVDVAYAGQNDAFNPFPVLGPAAAVLWLMGASVNFTPDAGASWVLGSTISGYSWSAPGASATSGLDTATPTISYNAAGTYRVSCTVTAANGKNWTGYRIVFVFSAASMPVTQFEYRSCVGDAATGGWEFEVTMHAEAGLANVRDQALCVLFAEDWYGNVLGSLGPAAGHENVIAIGWIDGETIEMEPGKNEVGFTVRGSAQWLSMTESQAFGIISAGSAANWGEISANTADKTIAHLLLWRSTVASVTDVVMTGSTMRLGRVDADPSDLWEQIGQIVARISARGLCDRYGRLFVEVDGNLLATAARSGIPTVMEISKADWRSINIDRRSRQASMVEVTGIRDDDDTAILMSRAPGNVLARRGKLVQRQNLVFDNQDDANLLCGMLLAAENNEYPMIEIRMAENNRFVDICPRQFVSVSIAEGDTARGIVWSGKKAICRRMEIVTGEEGFLETLIECEAETSGPPGVTVIPPVTDVDDNLPPIDFPEPGFPPFPPPTTWFPPVVPPEPPRVDACLVGDQITGPYPLIPDKRFLTSEDENEALKSLMYTHCNLRPADVTHQSILVITGQLMYRRVDGVWVHSQNPTSFTLRALDAEQNTVLLGVNDLNSDYAWNLVERSTLASWLKPISATEIHGFEIEIPNPSGTGYSGYWDFTGSESPMGWAPVPTNPSFPLGNVGPTGSLASADARGGVFSTAGGIGARGSLPDEPNPGDRINVWAFYPESVYTQVGSFLRGYNGEIAGFTGLGIKLADQSWHFVSWYTGGSQLRTVTIGANGANKKVTAFAFHSSHGGSDWTRLLNAEVGNFTTDITQYRLQIERIDLFNVCRVGD